jgi:hypothetical protein
MMCEKSGAGLYKYVDCQQRVYHLRLCSDKCLSNYHKNIPHLVVFGHITSVSDDKGFY